MGQLEQLAATLRSLEEQLLEPAVRRDTEVLEKLLADDFREFGSSGRVFTKAQILTELSAEVQGESSTRAAIQNFAADLVAHGLALVTYRSEKPGRICLRSSLWLYRSDRWQMIFHQGTVIPGTGP